MSARRRRFKRAAYVALGLALAAPASAKTGAEIGIRCEEASAPGADARGYNIRIDEKAGTATVLSWTNFAKPPAPNWTPPGWVAWQLRPSTTQWVLLGQTPHYPGETTITIPKAGDGRTVGLINNSNAIACSPNNWTRRR